MIKQLILPVLLCALLTLGAVTGAAEEYTVRSNADFTQAMTAINASRAAGTYRIILAANIEAGDVILAPSDAEKIVVIQGDTTARSIVSAADANLFYVNRGITLSLENNVRLNGNGRLERILWVDGGALVIKTGSCIEGGKGGAVSAIDGGVVTMSGGEIRGNEAGSGGGVYAYEGGVFKKRGGGTISGNTAHDGRTAYIHLDENNYTQRDADAGPGVDMDSAIGGSAGGWG
jgi:hypothetical protein